MRTQAAGARYQLTLAQLAEFDDLCTDALIDRAHYWITIRKLRNNYHANRKIKTEAVVNVITRDVARGRSVPTALENFLKLDGVKAYLDRLKVDGAKSDFI
ncbi:histone lysine methyltransferase Set9, partial [Rhizina undulata]